jgi:hypothetical protein
VWNWFLSQSIFRSFSRSNLMALAQLLGKECEVARTLAERQLVEYTEGTYQRLLFREETAGYGSELVTNELN